LTLYLALDRRTPDVGAAGYHICRKLPHLACSNFLPQLGQPRQWQSDRCSVTPESALQAAFDKLRGPVVAETDAAGLSLPAYLTANQVKAATELANRAKLPLRGTVAAPLAVAAHRAAWVLGGPADPPKDAADDEGRPDWVVPMHRPAPGPAAVVVVDADEFALTASVVAVEPSEVKSLAAAAWPRASLKAWKDRLLDALSDRCVRLCRRDPRDSADAEQALFEQLDDALDRALGGLGGGLGGRLGLGLGLFRARLARRLRLGLRLLGGLLGDGLLGRLRLLGDLGLVDLALLRILGGVRTHRTLPDFSWPR
jgi:hypothetical protein